jgi:hypothetical protein
MTKDEIIEMAKQAGFHLNMWQLSLGCEASGTLDELEAFAKLVAQHEREACAVVCDDLWEDDGTAYECAEAIRARGQA